MGILGLNVKQQLRRDSASAWKEKNPILSEGELGLELDTRKIKVGDGISNWDAIPYFTSDKANADLSNVEDVVFQSKISAIGVATSNKVGLVKPDGTTITVATDGKIAAKQAEIATTAKAGIIKPDGITLSIDANGQLKVVCDIGLFVEKNAGAHNSIYRGKYLGTTVTASQYASISAGTFDDLFIGDYWTISGVNYRIAAFDYYLHCGDVRLTTHHAVIVPDSVLYNATMNNTRTTEGGYVGSMMYKTNLGQAKNTIKAAFKGHVLKHRTILVDAVTNGKPSKASWYDSEIELMNEHMVYGGPVYMTASDGINDLYNIRIDKSQLPLFTYRPDLISRPGAFWLRDVVNTKMFARAGAGGIATRYVADGSNIGVYPSFCIY